MQRIAAANKVAKASNNVVTNYIPWEGNKKTSNKSRDSCKENNKSRKQWCGLDEYTFDLNDVKKCLDLLLTDNRITPKDPLVPIKLGDAQKENFFVIFTTVDCPIH